LAQAESQDGRREPVLTVLGNGSHEAKPEVAGFRATVSTEGRTLDAATRPHEERASRALKALQDLRASGLAIEKSNFRISERRVPRQLTPAEIVHGKRPESVVEAYVAATTFSVRSASLDKLNQNISKLAETGLFGWQKPVYSKSRVFSSMFITNAQLSIRHAVPPCWMRGSRPRPMPSP
jgi:uncharacterized protein YggE